MRRPVALFYTLLALPLGKRVGVAVGLLVTLTVFGTVGYMLIEDLEPLDALYMTVTTLATVGYGEVKPFGPAGRAFSIALIMLGLGTTLYTVGIMTQYFLEGRLGGMLWRRAMMRSLARLENHVILCGYGRLGKVVAQELTRAGQSVVVIDHDAALAPEMVEQGLHHVIGSALEDEILETAGIARARAIVITMPSDADSVFITLSARQLNPGIVIHARAETDTGARRLQRAGADQIISPHRLGGQRIANALIRPRVVEFLELSAPGTGPQIDMEEMLVGKGSILAGHAIDQALGGARIKALVVAVQRADQPMQVSPETDLVLEAGDRVVVVGERGQLAHLTALMKDA